MSIFNKFFDPVFDTHKEFQLAFDSRFNNFYEKESFQWPSQAFAFLPEPESLKLQAIYSKLTPYFECTGLLHIHNRQLRLLKKDIFGQKQDIQSTEIKIDISKAPFYQWLQLRSEKNKNNLIRVEFGIANASKFQVLIFRLSPDYAAMIITAQADPWLKIKLDALAKQMALSFCDSDRTE